MSRRRSSNKVTHVFGTGEPLSSNGSRRRLPRPHLTVLDQRPLRSSYAAPGRVSPLRISQAAPGVRREQRRFPASQVIQRPLLRSAPILPAKPSLPTRATDFCSRREARREVLFAQRVAGRKGRSPGRGGRYRRTAESYYRCRR